MAEISSSAQLNCFDVVKAVILTDSTLSSAFTNKIVEFDQNPKSTGFSGYPFMIVTSPEIITEDEFVGNLTDEKTFQINIRINVEYLARSKLRTYSNALLSVIESSHDTFIASGYYLDKINMEGIPNIETVHQKQVVYQDFRLILRGTVT